MNASDFDATMQKASDESYNLKSNNYVHNEYDHNRKVNINHLTDDEQKELSDFAAGIMNDMNKQVGLPEFSVNSDTQKMANDIAKGYIEDNRSLFDGKSHDFDRINHVAKDYGLNNTTGKSQYYENAAGWIIGAGHVTGNNSDESGWYKNNANPGETNMDEIKAGIYNSLKVMYFNHHEWYHAFGLLKSAEYNSNLYPDRKITYHFAYAASALPNSNEVTDHFIIVADSNKQNGSKINNANDQTVADLETTIAKVNNNQTALKIAKLNLDKANDQVNTFNALYTKAQQALNDATKQVQTAQRLARLANTKLESAKQDLANSKANLQKQLDIQKQAQDHYTESQKKLAKYQETVAQKQNVLAQAKQTLAAKQTALTNAEKNLSEKQTKLAQIKAIKSAQDLADQTVKNNQKHDQDKGKTDTTKPVDKPDQGKTTDTTKPVDKPDQGKTTDNTDVLTPVDDLADTSTVSAVDDLVSAPVVRASKLTAVKSANGQFILVNANGESIARQFVNIHDLIQYLLRNYKGEIAINNLVSLSKNANAYILDENGFNKSGVTLPSGMQCIITAIRVQNGKVYARIANSQYWIDADVIA